MVDKKITDMSIELEKLKKDLERINKRVGELGQDDKVKEYIEQTEKKKNLEKDFEKLDNELSIYKMCECKHLFVRDSFYRNIDPEMRSSDPIRVCLRCNVTNKYLETPEYVLTPVQKEMARIYYRTFKQGTIIPLVDWDIENTKNIVNEMLENNPEISNEEIEVKVKMMIKKNNN